MATSQPSQINLEAVLQVPNALPDGDCVEVEFTLINNSESGLYVLKWYTPLEGLGGEIFQVERDGQTIPYEGPLAMRGDPTPDAYVFLDSGASVSATVDLAAAYDFSEPNEYTITFISPRISHVARTEDRMAASVDDLGPVQIPSNRVTVRIGSSFLPPETPATPQIFSLQATPNRADPGDRITLTWEARGDRATICPTARFVLFSSDDCQQVPLSGTMMFTIPAEAAGFKYINFSLNVETHDFSSPEVAVVSVALKCPTTWFFSDEPQAGVCLLEPIGSHAAAQRFEWGTMIWMEQLGRYFILEETLLYEEDVRKSVHYVYDPLEIIRDTSAEVNPLEGLYAPEGGFGFVWRGDASDAPGYRESLGWALAPQFEYEAIFQCDDATRQVGDPGKPAT